MICLCALTAQAQSVAGYEYWFDNQFDSRITENTSSGDIVLETDVSTLAEGMHYFNFRAKDGNGLWSNPKSYWFFRQKTDWSGNTLRKYEYWLNDNYQEKISGTFDDTGEVSLELDVSALPAGFHYFNFRAQDNMNTWSTPVSYYFYRTDIDRSGNTLTEYEYWLDSNYQEKKTGKLAEDGVINLNALDVSALGEGYHYFNFRTQDSFGVWSSPVSYYFYRLVTPIPESNKIVQYQYSFNNDPATLQTVDIDPVNPLEWSEKIFDIPDMNLASVPDSFGLDINNDQTLSISVPTESRFALSFKDTVGIWSQPIVETFKHIIRKTTTATTLENNHPQSFAKPSEGKWVAFVIEIPEANSVYWKTDQPCSASIFTPDGKWMTCLKGTDLAKGIKTEIATKGTYYVFVHTAMKDASYPSETLSLIAITSQQSNALSVEVAGTLPELVSDPEAVVNLALTGYLNGTDIKFIRSLKNLQRLDISEARIVEGGDKYYENYLTADDVTGDYMFYNLPNLTHLAQEATVDVLSDAEEKLLAEIPVYRKKLEDAMDDDLNTADAISAIFELVKFANTNANDASSGAFVTALKKEIVALSDVLGLQVEKKEENLDAEIEKMIEERQAARKARDFKRADEIRDELLAQGIILEDTREGVKWKRA